MKRFTYTKANGDTSERVVYPIQMPSDSLFGLDLTEFTEEEQDHYAAQLELLYADVRDAIIDMGLNHQYRRFKEAGIEYNEE